MFTLYFGFDVCRIYPHCKSPRRKKHNKKMNVLTKFGTGHAFRQIVKDEFILERMEFGTKLSGAHLLQSAAMRFIIYL